MNIQLTSESPAELVADAIVIGAWEGEPLTAAAAAVDQACGGKITQLIESEEISTSRCSITNLLALTGIRAPLVAVVGLGVRGDAPDGLAARAAGTAAKLLSSKPRTTVAFYLDIEPFAQAVSGSIIGCVGQDLFRREKNLHPIKNILWSGTDESKLNEGEVLGVSTNLTRRLVNLPARDIYPESFATECTEAGRQAGFDVEIWDQSRLEQENCGALLAVAQGSARPPRLVIMRYQGGKSDAKPLALVGKGVTFDSGGLSLKPSASMMDMKCDMTGAATVLGALNAIAHLQLPVNVVGLVGLAENMVSGDCYKLGDVLTARSGKTIEVHNTDAEGRLVLADTLNVAVELGVDRIVDLATLTGACMVALGRDTSGLMTNDQGFCNALLSAARSVGEGVWQLPMFAEFSDQIQSKVADIKNVGDGRWGGAMTAGKFLEEFVENTPWVHIDIAGPSFLEKPKPWVDAGGSGCMVAALVEYARQNG